MSKKPKAEDSAKKAVPKRVVPKRQLSKWEKESRKRRIIGIIIAVVIAGVLISGGIVAYVELVMPWHQTVMAVNGTVYDMDYFVKMFRVQKAVYNVRYAAYGLDLSQYPEESQCQYMAGIIQTNELVRQKAEELSKNTGVDILDITDDDINKEFQSEFGYDSNGEMTEDEFNKGVNDLLESWGLSRETFEKYEIVPNILSERVKEAIGNEEYPIDETYPHVKFKAVLVGTEEEAEEVIGKWGDFNQIIKDYSPVEYYPESGYWLVMKTEGDGNGEEGELYIKAMLLATDEKADEIAAEVEDGGDFATLAQENSLDSSAENGGDMGWMSQDDIKSKFGDFDTINALEIDKISEPISQNYPDDPVLWLPQGIEKSSVFEDYVFSDDVEGKISDPIPDTTYQTTGGYWLVMKTEGDGNGEEGELYIKAMLLDSEKKANELKTEIEDGGDFATLAEEYSLDSSATDGGDMGWMSQVDIESKFGAGVLTIINDLGQDEISTPIQTTDGYWLVIVTAGDGNGEEGELYIKAILLATEDKAKEVAAEFDGSNFAELAEEYSLDSSAADGGDMGWMSQVDIESKFGAGVLTGINNLSQDEISTPIYDEGVTKQSGYWVIEVLEKKNMELIPEHRDKFVNEAYSTWLNDGKDSEGYKIVDYFDDKKISWVFDHI